MKNGFEKFLKKKKGPEMPENEKKAKMGVLHELQQEAGDAMAGKLAGLKKVSVMSDSKEGLKKGLDKAEEIMGSEDNKMSMDVGSEDEKDESSDEGHEMPSDEELDSAEPSKMSAEELDHHIECLKKLQEKK